jgi:threonine synthase
MEAYVFIPSDLEAGKVLGSAIYAPNLVAVDGSYDDVNRLCAELGDKYKWAFVNINMRPYYSEGSKTLGFEVAEQLGWRAPDHCVVPVGSGSLFTKIYKGLTELQKVGLLRDVHTPPPGRSTASTSGRSSRTPSPSRLRSATPPTVTTRCASSPTPRARRPPSATRRSSKA